MVSRRDFHFSGETEKVFGERVVFTQWFALRCFRDKLTFVLSVRES